MFTSLITQPVQKSGRALKKIHYEGEINDVLDDGR